MIIAGTEHWDGTASLDYQFDDGGRAAAGFKARAADCVARAVSIASERSYREVYDILASGNREQRVTKHSLHKGARGKTASHGIWTQRKWFKDYMVSLGFVWTPTMLIGQGCKVHLLKGELPMGRLVVAVSKHYTTVIDGVIHDTYDPSRATIYVENGVKRMTHRCVYGYWRKVEV